MAAAESSISGEVSNVTEAPPSLIPFDDGEKTTIKACITELQRIKEAMQREVDIATYQLQAYLYQMAVRKGVNLAAYEFNVEAGGFKKK